jgi:hypothetical protein
MNDDIWIWNRQLQEIKQSDKSYSKPDMNATEMYTTVFLSSGL